MNKELPLQKVLSLMAVLFFSIGAYAQLPAFTVNATPTAQTCLGNGTIALSVTGTNPSASIDYEVFLLPNTTDPYTTVIGNTATGLEAGTYLVVATQSLGAQSNTATATVVVVNQVQPLQYSITAQNVRCGDDGIITVAVTNGNAVSYEITAGPETRPLQASPVFNNLQTGLYQIRVYDNCGEAEVLSHQVVQSTTNILIDTVTVGTGPLPSCNTINVGNSYGTQSTNDIFYPLTAEFTVFPPGGGAPQVFTTTVPSGGDLGAVNATIPFYHGQQYSYNLKITDACGTVYTENNNIINRTIILGAEPGLIGCVEKNVTLRPSLYVGPYTLNFISAPPGFNPANYNPAHPTFNTGEVIYGQVGNALPEGSYTVQITDACGRTAQATFDIQAPDVNPLFTPVVVGCSDTGTIEIQVPGRNITSVIITDAPDEYTGTLPDNVSEFISAGGFEMDNLPIGDYTFTITDSCGDEHEDEDTTLEPGGTGGPLTALQRAGCAIGDGSVRLTSPDGFLISVTIDEAPDAFGTTPANVSANIASNGIFYMNSLPEGTYTFTSLNDCGITRTQDVIITGYHHTVNDIEIVLHCGSFDVDLKHTSNGNYIPSYYLQKFDPVAGTWGHPQTGAPYTEGTQPSPANSVPLINNTVNINNPYTGQFRILKVFHVFSNGSTANFKCFDTLHEFTFDGGPVITDAYNFPCANNLNEVAIIATGIPPLTYRITTKDGAPFVVNNGNSNIFSALEAAIYNFQVTDVCGNIRNIQFDLNELEPVAIEQTGFCEGELSTLSVQPFSFLSYEWYEISDPGTILSTTSELTFPTFNSTADAGTYVVNITSDNPDSCMNQELQILIEENNLPNAGADDTVAVCNDGTEVNLDTYLSNPHTAGGTWEDVTGTGALTGNMLDIDGLAEGTYEFRYVVTGGCNQEDDAVITMQLRDIPAAPATTPVAPICEGNNIQLEATTVTGATYEWTGPDGFTSNEQNPLVENLSSAAAGTYSVTATVNGCASPAATVSVAVNETPDFTIQGNAELCIGQGGTLSVAPENFPAGTATYQWMLDDEEITGKTESSVNIDQIGTYTVIVTSNGCTFEQTFDVAENTDAFEVLVEAGCENYDYILRVANADELPGASFAWTGPAGFTSTEESIDITNFPTGEYAVTVTNADGCTADGSLNIQNTTCIIPRGISPNNDDRNDYFDLSNLDVQELKIFNRFGIQVYEQENYVKEWYGQSEKGDLPTGTYFYVVTLSAGKQVTGWVYLQREIR